MDGFKIGLPTKIHIYLFDRDAARGDTLFFQKTPPISQLSPKYTSFYFCAHLTLQQTQASKTQANRLGFTNRQFPNHGVLLPASEKNKSRAAWHANILF